MKYISKKLPGSMVEVEAMLDHSEFLSYWQPVYDQALSNVRLKGFRPGRAPKDLADQAVDKEKIFNEAVSNAVRATLKEINSNNNWQLIDQPRVEVLESDPVKGIGLKFKATITIFPQVTLGNYQKIAKKILTEKFLDTSVNTEELEKSIQWVLQSRAKLTRVNRSAKKGNVVDIDFSGAVGGKPLDGAAGKADSFVLGEGKFVPGFEDQILDHKEGDKLKFSVNFPKDYWKQDLQDKKVDFEVSLKGVFERTLPELNDEFVKGLGNFQNVEDFKKSIQDGIEREKLEKEKEKLRLNVVGEIIKISKFELPAIMVDRTLDNLVAEYKSFSREDNPAIREKLREKAKNNVATSLVLYQIAKDQNLEPTPQEVEEEANKNPQIDSKKLYDYSYGIVQNRKVFEYLESLK